MFSNLTQTIYTILYFLALVMVFILPGSKLYLESVKFVGNRKLEIKDYLISLVPFTNTLETRKVYYGQDSWHRTAARVCVGVIALRLLVVAFLYDKTFIMLVSVLVNYIAMLVLYIVIAMIHVNIANMLECSGFMKCVCGILPPVGIFWLATKVRPFFRSNKEDFTNTFLTQDE